MSTFFRLSEEGLGLVKTVPRKVGVFFGLCSENVVSNWPPAIDRVKAYKEASINENE